MTINALAVYRQELDELDHEIVALIIKRFKVCAEIGAYKKAHDIPMMQPQRIQHVKKKAKELAESYGLNPHFIEALYTLIIEEACALQVKIISQ